MPFVKIPQAFFKKAKQEYNDWRFAFIREVVQNSVDAGATRIDFSVSEDHDSWAEDGIRRVRLSVTDNGRGMSDTTIVNVFLALGESSKEEGSVGGFGMAKNIILLAHHSWVVHSGTYAVHGRGGDYDMYVVNEFVDGTRIEVVLDEDTDEDQMRRAFDRFASASTLVNMNGTGVRMYWGTERSSELFPDFEYVKELELGTLQFKESLQEDSGAHTMWVRVNGIPMFEYRIWAHDKHTFRAILDLKNSLGRLTVNRDGLRSEDQQALNGLVHRLSGDLKSLKIGTETFRIQINSRNVGPYTRIVPNTLVEVDNVFAATRDSIQEVISTLDQRLVQQLEDPDYPQNFEVRVHEIVLRRSKNNEARSISIRKVRESLRKTMTKKLACAWTLACKSILSTQYMIDRGLTISAQKEFEWQGQPIEFGFVYDQQIEALCEVGTNSPIRLYVNPVVFDGLPWNGRKAFANLMDLAYHEVSHIIEQSHGATFCDVEMELRRKWRVYNTDSDLWRQAHRSFNGDLHVDDEPIEQETNP